MLPLRGAGRHSGKIICPRSSTGLPRGVDPTRGVRAACRTSTSRWWGMTVERKCSPNPVFSSYSTGAMAASSSAARRSPAPVVGSRNPRLPRRGRHLRGGGPVRFGRERYPRLDVCGCVDTNPQCHPLRPPGAGALAMTKKRASPIPLRGEALRYPRGHGVRGQAKQRRARRPGFTFDNGPSRNLDGRGLLPLTASPPAPRRVTSRRRRPRPRPRRRNRIATHC